MEEKLDQILTELKEIKQMLAGSNLRTHRNDPEDEELSSKEASQYLDIQEDKLYRLARKGEIKYFKVGSKFVYSKRELDECKYIRR